MPRIQFINDVNGGFEETHGSDSRLNVSSRSDGRAYYNSRDESEAYVATFDDANATAADYVFYLKNTKTDGKHLVIQHVGLNCEGTYGVFKMVLVDSSVAPSGGTAITPTNNNQAGVAKSATVDCQAPTDSDSTPMTLSAVTDTLDIASTAGAFGHEEFRSADTIRLGQNQAIAIELDAASATSVRTFGAVFFYFE